MEICYFFPVNYRIMLDFNIFTNLNVKSSLLNEIFHIYLSVQILLCSNLQERLDGHFKQKIFINL